MDKEITRMLFIPWDSFKAILNLHAVHMYNVAPDQPFLCLLKIHTLLFTVQIQLSFCFKCTLNALFWSCVKQHITGIIIKNRQILHFLEQKCWNCLPNRISTTCSYASINIHCKHTRTVDMHGTQEPIVNAHAKLTWRSLKIPSTLK